MKILFFHTKQNKVGLKKKSLQVPQICKENTLKTYEILPFTAKPMVKKLNFNLGKISLLCKELNSVGFEK